jgi:uncharacterized protein DUF927
MPSSTSSDHSTPRNAKRGKQVQLESVAEGGITRNPDFSDVVNSHALRVLDELDMVRRIPNGPSNERLLSTFSCRCPAHDDENPSGYVLIFRDGGFSIGCRASCLRADILAALNLRPADLAAPRLASRSTGKLIETYDYVDEGGNLLYQACRSSGPKGKRFFMRRRAPSGGWINSLAGVRQVPYRLPALIQAIREGQTVHVTEGEKDADRLTSIGFAATTNAMGAGKWRSEFNSFFAGADVVLLADNDKAGHEHAQAVAQHLCSLATRLRVVSFPEAGPKGDVSDWLDGGHTPIALADRIAQSSSWQGSSESPEPSSDIASTLYGEDEFGIYLNSTRGSEPLKVRLANFTARITLERSEDDGSEVARSIELKVATRFGEEIITIAAHEFASMNWVTEKVGSSAVIYTGRLYRDHIRCAIQLFSMPVKKHTRYTHTGWRKIEGRWCYLHGAGAISCEGLLTDTDVELSPSLANFQLPAPPADGAARSAISACLQLLDIGPPEITVTLFGAVYRAPLGASDFSVHLTGASGVFKSELAALAMQHCGARFDARHFPVGWNATANAIESMAFQLKDAPIVVDDFCPRGSAYDRSRLQGAADRILRAQANSTARVRMRADTTLRPPKPPRGIIISTGEDGFDGKSLNARVLTVEIPSGAIDPAKLTRAQAQAREGIYAAAFSGYIRWLANQRETLHAVCEQERHALRSALADEGQHARTPDMMANIALGWRMFLRYAKDSGVISVNQLRTYESGIFAALASARETQISYQAETDPARQFINLVVSAIRSQRVHVSNLNGEAPANKASAWGWKERPVGGDGGFEWYASGDRIGFVDHERGFLYLDEDSAFRSAQDIARGGGNEIALTKHALRKRLGEGQYLVGEHRGGKHYWQCRATILGQRMAFLRIPLEKLVPNYTGEIDGPDLSSGQEFGQ